MRTQVCITVDTEFSIAGAFRERAAFPVAGQRVWCVKDDQSHGLGFMLNCFRQYGITATFFVEVLNKQYFKHDPMREIAEQLHTAGHDVQLHLHPCWTIFQHADWRERARIPVRPGLDAFFGRAEDESLRLMEDGLETFHTWQLPTPAVFRTGACSMTMPCTVHRRVPASRTARISAWPCSARATRTISYTAAATNATGSSNPRS